MWEIKPLGFLFCFVLFFFNCEIRKKMFKKTRKIFFKYIEEIIIIWVTQNVRLPGIYYFTQYFFYCAPNMCQKLFWAKGLQQ